RGCGGKLFNYGGCNRNFTGEQGRISNSNSVAGSRCHVTIQAKPNHTISLYFNQFFFANSEGCLNVGMEVRDGLYNDAPVIIRMCGHRLPDPIFSTSSTLSLSMWSGEFRAYDRYDITYTTTDQDFDLGPRRSCDTEFLNIYEVDKASSSEVFRTKYCAMDNPQRFVASSNVIVVQYVTSINSVGRGWAMRFSHSRTVSDVRVLNHKHRQGFV
ncbi:hypothetical protein J437_LFUL011448, partial [Ladona fulva]